MVKTLSVKDKTLLKHLGLRWLQGNPQEDFSLDILEDLTIKFVKRIQMLTKTWSEAYTGFLNQLSSVILAGMTNEALLHEVTKRRLRVDAWTWKTAVGEDWKEMSCPKGFRIIGGGCDANPAPHKMQISAPTSDTAFTCGGHGGSKYVSIMCVPEGIQIVRNTTTSPGNEWAIAECRQGYNIVGGGCATTSRLIDTGTTAADTSDRMAFLFSINAPHVDTTLSYSKPYLKQAWK